MAESTTKKAASSKAAAAEAKDDGSDSNVGTPDPNATTSADVQAAEAAGITEGEFKALRDEAGLNQSAGHMANIGSWEASAQGQEWLEGEDDRVKANEEEAEKYDEQTNDDGLTEAEAAYFEAVEQGGASTPSDSESK